jgi:hypothetical protein
MAQLSGSVPAASVSLSDDHMSQLNDASTLTPGFISSLAAPMIRNVLYGKHSVIG